MKSYIKPSIIFESFTSSTNIAGDCEGIVGNPSKGTCAVEATGGIHIFDNTVGAACIYKSPVDNHDGYCYHIPSENKTLFNS